MRVGRVHIALSGPTGSGQAGCIISGCIMVGCIMPNENISPDAISGDIITGERVERVAGGAAISCGSGCCESPSASIALGTSGGGSMAADCLAAAISANKIAINSSGRNEGRLRGICSKGSRR